MFTAFLDNQVTIAGVLVWVVPDSARVVGHIRIRHRMGRQSTNG